MDQSQRKNERKSETEKIGDVGPGDPLTQLPNRVSFEARVQDAILQSGRRDQPFAIVCLELDGSGEIEERFGGVVADQVLKSQAAALQKTLRRGDILARLCGQRFVAIILNVAAHQEILPAVHRMMHAATTPVMAEDHQLQSSASIGVSFYPQELDVEAQELISQAEEAMLQSQKSGRNLYSFCNEARSEGGGEKERRLDRIRQALREGEFVLFYQPRVHLSRGEVFGVEALVRWRHPDRGLLAPAAFLPQMDENHLGIELGEWVLESALRQIKVWNASGQGLTVSVNISPYHLMQPDFVRRLEVLLEPYSTEVCRRLELEIFGAGSGDPKPIAAVANACKKMGIRVILDDFGSVRATLADLRQIPVQGVKISPLFVRDLQHNPDDVVILESMLNMTRSLGRQCAAVGVESVAVGLQLLHLGCEKAQGYGIALPMEGASIPEWIAGWKPDSSWMEANTVGVEERLLVYTQVEHQAWITALGAFLRDERDSEPVLGRHQCQLGHFIDAEEQAGRNTHSSFQSLAALHWRIHALGTGIVKLYNQGKSEEGMARLADLRDLFEKMIEQLRAFRMKV